MSLARMTSGELAAAVTSSACAVARTRSAPPEPVASAWQPELAQVFVAPEPTICSCATKIGLMQRWK